MIFQILYYINSRCITVATAVGSLRQTSGAKLLNCDRCLGYWWCNEVSTPFSDTQTIYLIMSTLADTK